MPFLTLLNKEITKRAWSRPFGLASPVRGVGPYVGGIPDATLFVESPDDKKPCKRVLNFHVVNFFPHFYRKLDFGIGRLVESWRAVLRIFGWKTTF